MRDPNAKAVLNTAFVEEMRAGRRCIGPKPMTTSHLIQILCKMDPNTPVYVSIDGYPPQDIRSLDACYDDLAEGKKVVVLTSKKVEEPPR